MLGILQILAAWKLISAHYFSAHYFSAHCFYFRPTLRFWRLPAGQDSEAGPRPDSDPVLGATLLPNLTFLKYFDQKRVPERSGPELLSAHYLFLRIIYFRALFLFRATLGFWRARAGLDFRALFFPRTIFFRALFSRAACREIPL